MEMTQWWARYRKGLFSTAGGGDGQIIKWAMIGKDYDGKTEA